MKTRELTENKKLSNIYKESRLTFCPVLDHELQGYQTKCKEEIGEQAVKHKWHKFVMVTPFGTLTDTEVDTVLKYVNGKEKEANVKATIFERVKDQPSWLLVTHSPRWSRNSVAHSILITWLRYAVAQQCPDMWQDETTDGAHLNKCYWLLDIVKKKGLRVFGTRQHERYDVGMVSFMHRIKTDRWGVNGEDEPNEYDYGSTEEWEDALADWENDQDVEMGMGDLDGSLPKYPHAYTKLMEIYNA